MEVLLPPSAGSSSTSSAPSRTHSNDSRLLTNLIRSEKDNCSALSQATATLHTAASALGAWGASEGSGGIGTEADLASTSAGVAALLHQVADAERTHVAALDGYREALKDVLVREQSLRDVLRDRDILVGRLIKLSKKRVKDSRVEAQAEKLRDAQKELRACETVLAAEQAALVGVKRRTFKEALTMRAKTMGDVGTAMQMAANRAVLLLDQFDVQNLTASLYDRPSDTYPASQPAISDTDAEYFAVPPPPPVSAPQQLLPVPYSDPTSTFQDSASYTGSGYSQVAPFPPSMYPDTVPTHAASFMASETLAQAPAHDPYEGPSMSTAPSIDPAYAPSTSAPSHQGSIVATPIERPSISGPHRLTTQAQLYSSEQGGEASDTLSLGPTHVNHRVHTGGLPTEVRTDQAVDNSSNGLPASAPDRTTTHDSAVRGSSSASVHPSAPLRMRSNRHVSSRSSLLSGLSDEQLQHLSLEQQQQYFAQQQQFAPRNSVPQLEPSRPHVYEYADNPYTQPYSAPEQPVQRYGDRPGLYRRSSSYQRAVQVMQPPEEEGSEEDAIRDVPDAQAAQAEPSKKTGIFNRMSKLFRNESKDPGGDPPSLVSQPPSDATPEDASIEDRNEIPARTSKEHRSFLSRASHAVVGKSGSDDEPISNGQMTVPDNSSTRTGKRSLLSRISGKGTDADLAQQAARQEEEEMHRRTQEAVIGTGIGGNELFASSQDSQSQTSSNAQTKSDATGAKPEESSIQGSTAASDVPIKRKVPKKAAKRPSRPESRGDSEPSANKATSHTRSASSGATGSNTVTSQGAGTTTIKRSSSMANKLRALTVTGDASMGMKYSKIASAGHGSAAGAQSNVTPLPAGKFAISNWVSSLKDVPSAGKAAQHTPRTRISSGSVTSLTGRQVEGFAKAKTPAPPPEEVVDRDKTPRPRPSSSVSANPGSRPASRTNRASSLTPTTASSPLTSNPPTTEPLVVTAPPRASDVLAAPKPVAGQPSYLTHYDPGEIERADTATPTAAARVRTASGTGSGKKKFPSTPLPPDHATSTANVKRRGSLTAPKPSAVPKHVPASHDARPLSPALKHAQNDSKRDSPVELAHRKSVRMAPDTKFTEHTRPVSRSAHTTHASPVVVKKKRSLKHVSPAPVPPPLVIVPFQATAPGSSIVRADQPSSLPLTPSLHSVTPSQQPQQPSRPASAPSGEPFIARAPGSSLGGMGFVPTAPGSAAPSTNQGAPVRRASNPTSRTGPISQAAAPRSASAAGWSSRIGVLNESSDDEPVAAQDNPAAHDEYAKARRAFSSASKHLGAARGVSIKRANTTTSARSRHTTVV